MKDEAGFREFVQGGSRRHLRAAYFLTGNAVDAEDLLQTSLAKLMRVWDRVSSGGDPDAYLRTVIVNTQASRWRRKWRGEVATDELPDAGVDPYPTSDARDELRRRHDVDVPAPRSDVRGDAFEYLGNRAGRVSDDALIDLAGSRAPHLVAPHETARALWLTVPSRVVVLRHPPAAVSLRRWLRRLPW